jgi:hypothetical protein
MFCFNVLWMCVMCVCSPGGSLVTRSYIHIACIGQMRNITLSGRHHLKEQDQGGRDCIHLAQDRNYSSGFCDTMQLKACNSLTLPNSYYSCALSLSWIPGYGSKVPNSAARGSLVLDVSDLDCRTGFCRSVLVTRKGTGEIPRVASWGRRTTGAVMLYVLLSHLYWWGHPNLMPVGHKRPLRHPASMRLTYPYGPVTCHALVLKCFVVIVKLSMFWLTTVITCVRCISKRISAIAHNK